MLIKINTVKLILYSTITQMNSSNQNMHLRDTLLP